MKLLILSFLSMLTAACMTGYNPTYSFNEIHVVNLTGSTIKQVSLQVGGSGRQLDCDELSNYALCHDRFGSRRYPREVIDLGWIHGDGSEKSQQLTPHIPAYFASAFPLRFVFEIREDGTVKAIVQQDEPGRNGGFFLTP